MKPKGIVYKTTSSVLLVKMEYLDVYYLKKRSSKI